MATTKKTLACGKDFYDSVNKLPGSIKSRVLDLYNKLMTSVDGNGLNFESLNCTDKSFRSVRLDDTYRVILSQQPNSYILLWADHHDRAYEWASKRRLNLNAVSGTLELVEMNQSVETVKVREYENATAETDADPVFASFSDADLRALLSLTDETLAHLRTYKSDDHFLQDESALKQELGEQGFNILFDLACGENYETVKENYHLNEKKEQPQSVDEALNNEYSSMNFHVITTEEELQMALSWPLDRWRIFLHPSQKALVNKDHNGPFRVTGGAGTGKTVAAMHRAAWLAARLEENGEPGKVLFTTFTKNLAGDIENNLRKICTPEQLRRIEVMNLDAWAVRLLKTAGSGNIKLSWQLEKAEKDDLWECALSARSFDTKMPEGMTDNEIRREWEQVIQAYDIMTQGDYLRVARTGRGIRLNKEQKKELWNVFDEYRFLLKQNNVMEAEDVYRTARELIEHNPALSRSYVSVVVDEAQDFGNAAFRLLAAIVKHCDSPKNTMYITGDAHQRIYKRKVVLSRCGIDVRGRSRKLRINYRTTEETRIWASAVLKDCRVDDLDGATDDLKGYHSLMHGEQPLINEKGNEEEELRAITDYIDKLAKDGCPLHGICLVVCNNDLVDTYKKRLSERKIPIHLLNGQSEPTEGHVSIATMFRVKGLEFDYMILAGMTEDNLNRYPDRGNEDDLMRYRSLIHVAATRARRHVLITSPAPMISWVKK